LTQAAWDQLADRLDGAIVTLEPLSSRHEQDLFEASQHADIWPWLLGAAPTREQFHDWFDYAGGRAA
jgi:hypothetical protein